MSFVLCLLCFAKHLGRCGRCTRFCYYCHHYCSLRSRGDNHALLCSCLFADFCLLRWRIFINARRWSQHGCCCDLQIHQLGLHTRSILDGWTAAMLQISNANTSVLFVRATPRSVGLGRWMCR